MKVRAKENEVIWVIGSKVNKGPQANYMLKSQLGEFACSFVPMDVGAGYYTWELPGTGWIKLSQATPEDAVAVKRAFAEIKRSVGEKVTNAAVLNSVFTVPNNDYIFFRQSAKGKLEIMVTAWGFKNHNKAVGGPITKVLVGKAAQKVSVGFTIAGELVPDRVFTSCHSYQQLPAQLTTSENGLYSYGQEMEVGDTLEIVDIESGKVFVLNVTDGVDEYKFDVSERCCVNVSVIENDRPKAGVEVKIGYNGDFTKFVTDANGDVSTELVFMKDCAVTVMVEGERQEELVNLNGNRFCFKRYVEQVYVAQVKVNVTENGNPVNDEPVHVSCGENDQVLLTGEDGMALCELRVTGCQDIQVEVREVIKTQAAIDGDVTFLFDFEKEQEVHVALVSADESPLAGCEVDLVQDTKILHFILDEDGGFIFDRRGFSNNQEIVVKFEYDNKRIEVPFMLDEDETEYWFQAQLMQRPWWHMLAYSAAAVALVAASWFVAPYFVQAAESVGNMILKM